MKDAKYNYKSFETKHVSVEMLDGVAGKVFMGSATTWGRIMAWLTLMAYAAYYITRSKLIDHQMMLAKQEYEQQQSQSNQDQLDEMEI